VWALFGVWRSERRLLARILWTAVVVLLPVWGVLVYAVAGNRSLRLGRRLAVTLGGAGAWLVATVASLLIGGVF
jgi:hypothetical protein